MELHGGRIILRPWHRQDSLMNSLLPGELR
jgi:hypothetical protein